MPKNVSFDDMPPKPKSVKDTKLLTPGANEPKEFQTGNNEIKRDTSKHPPFGQLGTRNFP